MADKSNGDMQEALAAFLNQAAAERPARPVTPLASPVAASPPPAQPAVTPTGKEELLAAFDRLVEHEATKPTGVVEARPPLWKTYLVPSIGAGAFVATLYLWIGQPGWLYPRIEPIDEPRNSLQAKQFLVATSALVEQYRQQHGRNPIGLEDVGLHLPWLSLSPDAGGGYRVVGGTTNQPLMLRAVPGTRPAFEAFPR